MAEKYEMPCKEPGCDKTVIYEREIVHGFKSDAKESKLISVYLTCADDHTHKYIVEKPS